MSEIVADQVADLVAPRHARLVIVGSGAAGLTAALYAARAGLAPLVIEGLGAGGPPGGQLAIADRVENFPGSAGDVTGPELIAALRAQAERAGADFLIGDVERAELASRPFHLACGGIDAFAVTCDALVLATGGRARRLGLPSEERLWGRGVSACATCDAVFFEGEDVVVVGGGDTAMDDALLLAERCREVTIVHRRDTFRAAPVLVERARRHPKIRWATPFLIEDIVGEDAPAAIRLRHAVTNEPREIAARGLFLAVGYVPNSALFSGQLALDAAGYVRVGHGSATATSVPGVFAAGELADPVYRQAITAAGMGCQAALDAARWLAGRS